MAKFKISKRSNGEFQFNLVAGNGEVILTSESYGRKEGCLNGIESVKINSKDLEKFEMRISKDGKRYFVLKSNNGQIIGQSQLCSSEDGCENGIDSVMKNAPKAEIEKEKED